MTNYVINQEPSTSFCHMVQDFPTFPTKVSQFNFLFQENYTVPKTSTQDRVFYLLGNKIDHPQIVNDTQYPIKLNYCQTYHQLVIPPHDSCTIQQVFTELGSTPINLPLINYILDTRYSVTYQKARALVDHDRPIEFYVTSDVLYELLKFTNRSSQFATVYVMTVTSVERLPRSVIDLE